MKLKTAHTREYIGVVMVNLIVNWATFAYVVAGRDVERERETVLVLFFRYNASQLK